MHQVLWFSYLRNNDNKQLPIISAPCNKLEERYCYCDRWRSPIAYGLSLGWPCKLVNSPTRQIQKRTIKSKDWRQSPPKRFYGEWKRLVFSSHTTSQDQKPDPARPMLITTNMSGQAARTICRQHLFPWVPIRLKLKQRKMLFQPHVALCDPGLNSCNAQTGKGKSHVEHQGVNLISFPIIPTHI